MARGVWRITGGTMVIEFADHMTLFEVDGQPARIKQVIEKARAIVPNKPVTQVIVSHHHFDHTSGLREAVAMGITPAPRLVLCGRPITITGGHLWYFGQEADGPDGVRRAVEVAFARGLPIADAGLLCVAGGEFREITTSDD